MPATKTTNPTQATVRRGVFRSQKVADALESLSTTCTAGAACTEVQNDPVASKALGVLQTAVTTSQASQTKRNNLGTQYFTAKRTAAADFVAVGTAADLYEQAIAALAKGDATLITKAGCEPRNEGGPHAALEMVTGVLSKLGKLPTQAVVRWPAAPGASSYAVEVNWTPQNPTGTWTAIGSGTGRRWVITAPTPGAQFLVRIAAQGAHGQQAAWSTAILATAR